MFRFSIRELMLVMMVVGMGLGWWNDRWRLKAEIRISGERAEFLKWRQAEVVIGQFAGKEVQGKRAFSKDTYERLLSRHP